MSSTTARTFKSGNSEAVRLPKGFGFGLGRAVRIEREGDRVVLTPVVTDNVLAEKRRRFDAMIARMVALGAVPGGAQQRDEFEAPDRPGL
jgi:antitoxin VapB